MVLSCLQVWYWAKCLEAVFSSTVCFVVACTFVCPLVLRRVEGRTAMLLVADSGAHNSVYHSVAVAAQSSHYAYQETLDQQSMNNERPMGLTPDRLGGEGDELHVYMQALCMRFFLYVPLLGQVSSLLSQHVFWSSGLMVSAAPL